MDDIDRQSRVRNYGDVSLGHIKRAVQGGTRSYDTFDDMATSIVRLGTPADLFDDVMDYVMTRAREAGLDGRYHDLPEPERGPAPSRFNDDNIIPILFGHVHNALVLQRPPRGGILGVFVNVSDAAGEEEPEN